MCMDLVTTKLKKGSLFFILRELVMHLNAFSVGLTESDSSPAVYNPKQFFLYFSKVNRSYYRFTEAFVQKDLLYLDLS